MSNRHIYQILTKRPERLEEFLKSAILPSSGRKLSNAPIPNVMFGTSTEDQKSFNERVPSLCRAPCTTRFLSMEPLLGPIDIKPLLAGPFKGKIHWIIVGGESGFNWRPMDVNWARQIRDDAASLGIPFFFKQFASFRPKELGRELDGVVHNEMPKLPKPWDKAVQAYLNSMSEN